MTFRFPIAIAFALAVAGVAAAATPPHIVLVSVDTLRADRLGAYGYDQKTSPFLDSLAEGGWRFEQALVPLPATTPSHASLLTSSLPSRHGSLGNAYGISRTVDTLAQALARKGYRTAGAVAVSHIGRKQGFERGFHSFTEPEATTQNPHGDLRRDAIAVNRDALGAVDRHVAAHRARPLFLFVHYFDAHYPYRWWDAAESNPNPYAPAEINDVAKQNRRYDEGVRHVDAQLRRLHDGVRAKLGTNVIFVVTSDHGEQLGEHGFTGGHADIYRETVRVPLIVSGARIEKATITTTVSTMDVGVSLLKLAGGR
ncbi:MAG TPA: sulfatase, partial [Thermoanaerobaculia bacterium]|nr:sulfatase [Thermoanaerobaculia bacterium]